MPDLLAGTVVKAADWPAAAFAQDATNILNITSTTYIAGTPEVGVTFIPPTTGRVLLIVGASTRGGPDRVLVSPEVYLGTSAAGTKILSANAVARGVGSWATSRQFTPWSRVSLLEGLQPEATHYARIVYHAVSGSGVADISIRDITVVPVP